MSRYFLTSIKIEGFRGIRNEGQPLEIKLKSDAVNSVFAANGLGKSSLFEAVTYAITGTIPKLDKMLTAESAKDYYNNKFHSKKRSEISLVFAADDGSSKDITITVVRDANGRRIVTSPSGYGDPNGFLATLADEAVLLDHQTFVKFLLDSPLERGKAFSALLGLSKIAEMRQGLLAVSNTTAFNSDSDLKTLEGNFNTCINQLNQSKQSLKQDHFNLTGLQLPDPYNSAKVAADTVSALANVPLLKPFCDNVALGAIDFVKISATIKGAEKSEDQDKLKKTIQDIASLESLLPLAGESAEQERLLRLCEAKDLAFALTRGHSFQDLYDAVRTVFEDGSWEDKTKCPACESVPAVAPYDFAIRQLRQYASADSASSELIKAWKQSACVTRLQKLEIHLTSAEDISANLYSTISNKLNAGKASQADLASAFERIKNLDTERLNRISDLKAIKVDIEKTLPPSLVTLIEQVERAKRIKELLKQIDSLIQTAKATKQKVDTRKRWKTFIDNACQEFETAESRLSEKLTASITSQYKEMYATIANGRHIVPSIEQKKNSIDLNLKLEYFFGLKNTSATPLLSESYRNAVAIALFLSASLQRKPTARFLILDDVTSSFDAGHQFALMEVLRTQVGLPLNKTGMQVIILSHDGLLEKYFDRLNGSVEWNHQHLQGLPPDGNLMTQAQGAERLRSTAETLLNAGQSKQAEPLIRQHLEFRLLQIISKLAIPVPLDFAIREDRKMVSNSLDAIKSSVELVASASRLILTQQQLTDFSRVHVPAIVANWVSHFETASTASLDPRVLLGVLNSCDSFADCFKYDCTCSQPGKTIRRYYRSLSAKSCNC